MKHILLIAGIVSVCSFAACESVPSVDNANTKKDTVVVKTESKEERNKKVVMTCMEALMAHDVEKVMSVEAIDFTEMGDGTGASVQGDAAKHALEMYLNSFPDMKAENSMYFADGNNVVVVSDWTMTFKNDMGTIKATNKTAYLKDVGMYTLNESGKIVSHRNVYPSTTLMLQLGVDLSKMKK